jgi:Cof subfamily protein (haloacid dehalogenase superfamily)
MRMVATDMDGTFLASDGTAPALNVEAVLRAAELDVTTVFATGRPCRWLQPLDPVRAAHPLAITSNGAVIFDLETATVREFFPVPIADAIGVAVAVKAVVPDAGFAVEYTQGWGRDSTYQIRGDMVVQDVLTEDIDELLTARVAVKLLIMSQSLPTLDLYAAVEPLARGRLDVTYSWVMPTGLLELSAPGVSKASALKILLDEAGVAAAELVAFGDMPNDVEMLRLAGRGFAMTNAQPELLAEFEHTAGTNDDAGFARTLLTLLDANDS